MNAYTKGKMDTDKKNSPEKYHHISAKKLDEFIDEPCFWVKEGVSFSDIERTVSAKYKFKEVHIYYTTPNEIKKNGMERLDNRYLAGCTDSLFFFVKKENVDGDMSSENTLSKFLARNE